MMCFSESGVVNIKCKVSKKTIECQNNPTRPQDISLDKISKWRTLNKWNKSKRYRQETRRREETLQTNVDNPLLASLLTTFDSGLSVSELRHPTAVYMTVPVSLSRIIDYNVVWRHTPSCCCCCYISEARVYTTFCKRLSCKCIIMFRKIHSLVYGWVNLITIKLVSSAAVLSAVCSTISC